MTSVNDNQKVLEKNSIAESAWRNGRGCRSGQLIAVGATGANPPQLRPAWSPDDPPTRAGRKRMPIVNFQFQHGTLFSLD